MFHTVVSAISHIIGLCVDGKPRASDQLDGQPDDDRWPRIATSQMMGANDFSALALNLGELVDEVRWLCQ